MPASHPSRVCGLKYPTLQEGDRLHLVTPFTGVWIEIDIAVRYVVCIIVTPFTGVWIEIGFLRYFVMEGLGHTLHGCVD